MAEIQQVHSNSSQVGASTCWVSLVDHIKLEDLNVSELTGSLLVT